MATPEREFMLWLKDRIDDTGDDVTVTWPDDPDSEVLDVIIGDDSYSLHVSHVPR